MFLMILPHVVLGQNQFQELREFDITPVQSSRIPVFTKHPDKAAVIFNSSLTNLRFDSNLEIIEILGDATQGEYILIVNAARQIITVSASGFQQGRIQISLTEARQVAYYKVEPKPEVATKVIPTIIQVTPSDAKVTIDGNPVDITKPVPIEVGTHKIRIEKRGYRTIEKDVRISAEQNLIRETLVAIEVVPLTIKTQPVGATILIDGVRAGVTDRDGDLNLSRFPGTYDLGLQLSGYLPENRSITVTETGPNTFSYLLIRNIGVLRLTVSPTNAVVLVNRQRVDASQPIEVVPGRVQVEISLDDHESILETLNVMPGQTLPRTMTLLPHTGSLEVSAQPQGTAWTLTNANGQVVERGNSGMVKQGLRVGNYTLTLSSPGFETVSEAIRIENNQTTRRSIALKIPIRIRSDPSGSTVTLDGQRIGETDQTGFLDLLLLPGSYNVLVQKSGYLDQATSIVASATGQKTMVVNLVRNAGTLRLSVAPADARVFLNRRSVDASQPIELTPGTVQIEVNRANFDPYVETIEVQRGVTITRNISLLPHTGSLRIATSPFNTRWTLTDPFGKVVDSGNGPSQRSDIPVGSYTLTATSPGMVQYQEQLRISKDDTSIKDIVLARYVFSRLTLMGNLPDTTGVLKRNGQIIREIRGSGSIEQLPFGEYVIEYPKHRHYKPIRKRIRLNEENEIVKINRKGWFWDGYWDIISIEAAFPKDGKTVPKVNILEVRYKYFQLQTLSFSFLGNIDRYKINGFDDPNYNFLELFDFLSSSIYLPIYNSSNFPTALGLFIEVHPIRNLVVSLKEPNSKGILEKSVERSNFNSATIALRGDMGYMYYDWGLGPVGIIIEAGYHINRRDNMAGIPIPNGPYLSVRFGFMSLVPFHYNPFH